mmetsp:Transcript_4106/g.4761  ORF Transcript_4106/g.4761 Transcript_4106/m.4761 type:complete len:83 (-) Transcript_4106:565-813(-)
MHTRCGNKPRRGESKLVYHALFCVYNTKINEIAFAPREDKILRANEHMGPGKEGSRAVRSDVAKKRHGGNIENLEKTKKQHA